MRTHKYVLTQKAILQQVENFCANNNSGRQLTRIRVKEILFGRLKTFFRFARKEN